MKIFYFSGTGNSYYAAKKIHQNIDHVSNLESITDYLKCESVELEEDILIVSPVYYYGVPHVVKNFIEKIKLNNCGTFSIVFTAEYPNGIAIDIVKEILKRKNIELQSAFYLKMPTNFILKSRMLNELEIERVFKLAFKKLKKIINYLNSGKSFIEKESKLYSILMRTKYKYYTEWETLYSKFDSYFSVNDNCNKCKKCKKYCPINNIEVDNIVRWNGTCVGCLKCINICQNNAIHWNEQTIGKYQYFNKLVKLGEFK